MEILKIFSPDMRKPIPTKIAIPATARRRKKSSLVSKTKYPSNTASKNIVKITREILKIEKFVIFDFFQIFKKYLQAFEE